MSDRANEGGPFKPVPIGNAFIIPTPNWEAFEQSLKPLRSQYGRNLLFRGQADSTWRLLTTLERSGAGGMRFDDYYRLVCTVAPEIKAFANIEAPRYAQSQVDSFANPQLLWDGLFPEYDLYRYLAYLRHHGFPSPLLDWSRSPFVAAFFAFRESNSATTRAIFAYCESPEGTRSQTIGEATIHHLGPYIQTHHRHFRQQCDYTICARFEKDLQHWMYDAHQEAFESARLKEHLLWKFEIPSIEREKVLGLLNDYNLNAFSLFGSEEGLLETMWFREYVLKRSAMTTATTPNLPVADSPLKAAATISSRLKAEE